ncbi:GNAT family N-acetyltransferase [Mesorhizobium sp. M00.F.Ca.ET.217.01.1.1]|uniref:GNAT family N-acetyltransferase n=1 Tax=Mesorhizobium sp. M00.F.Ca.ET.217.01.1.1 TaxID=2500529 RepID=UPI000FD870AA|nr:GNAT family N-acetyltransferase [Mesorhizobium sp. M00.F.Ca.ET.217.01.1.1]TGQ11363.1 GNAT family N-acetyltransferase [Mesorhizobium sp. M00.F.Ca.ET.217.01.1.1]TGV83789.1 GNAT family N-acetyltransferase [Mesorhizobium sp. M00.F.Ca.ET.158.01.1.1]
MATENANLTFRFACKEDCGAIHGILQRLAESLGLVARLQTTPQDLESFGFGPNPHFKVLFAEIEGNTVGMCLFFPYYSTWIGRPGLYIQDLFVDEQYRGERIGERLLRHVARIGREGGCTHMRLTVDDGNEGAVKFYQRHGFILSTDESMFKLVGAEFDNFCDLGDCRGLG